ncbi:uncharacterized protein DNG_06993 [Cephalotrichum gorgonifer]|uniref:Uncharacterized protein n=1 Tax=Cephalotrichum gorgonifer TaxID=2041049 RepID=A0AAE8N0W4_9PEZI|nr:uncharacterized protein DNG_06993 [Cephalotrichum gorgonifer]
MWFQEDIDDNPAFFPENQPSQIRNGTQGCNLFCTLTCYERRQLRLARAAVILQSITTVTAIITTVAAVASLCWWWGQHYMLYRRNHIHHRHIAREEAREARQRNRTRPRSNGRASGAEPPSIPGPPGIFRDPIYRRETGALQRELEAIINEARARQERLRVPFTLQEMESAVEFRPEMSTRA